MLVSNAPQKADTGTSPGNIGKKEALSSAKKPAPELTPIILGLAKALFNTACIKVPLTAKAAPAAMAAIVLGKREYIKIRYSVVLDFPWMKSFHNSKGENIVLPVKRLKQSVITNSKIIIKDKINILLCVFILFLHKQSILNVVYKILFNACINISTCSSLITNGGNKRITLFPEGITIIPNSCNFSI